MQNAQRYVGDLIKNYTNYTVSQKKKKNSSVVWSKILELLNFHKNTLLYFCGGWGEDTKVGQPI